MADEPTANDELLDRVIRHQVYLERFKASELPRLINVLDELDADLTEQIASATPESLGARRLEAQLEKVNEISDAAVERYESALNGTLTAFGEYESGWASAALAAAAGAEFLVVAGLEIYTPDPNLLRAAIYSRPLQGKLLKDWVSDLGAARRGRLNQAIRLAAIESQTTEQLVRRIRGTRENGYKDGILDISRRGAEGIARTALQHVSNQARGMSYEQNSAVVDMVQWVSTLDSRTTAICRALDGKRFALDKGPRPPAHINCRSTTVPVLKSWADIGIDAGEISEGTRASMNGQVPDSLDYDAWLRRQSTEFQDDVLGKSKAELFRNGLKMDRFVDLASGKEFTLSQLREREPDVWRATFGGTRKNAGTGFNVNGLGEDDFMPFAPLGAIGDRPDLQAFLDNADHKLEQNAKKASEAITDFIGHRPESRDPDDSMLAFGVMSARKLEAMALEEGDDWAALAAAFEPVRQRIVDEFGDTIRLYRVQRPVDWDDNTFNMSRGETQERQVLSWTSDEKFARWHAGINRTPPPLYTAEQIAEFERTLEEAGEVRIGSQTLRYVETDKVLGTKDGRPPDIWREPENIIWGKGRALMIFDKYGEEVTDTDSVRWFVENENKWRKDALDDYAAKLKLIVSADVPMSDVVWISDRAAQSEFIVRNRPGTAYFIDHMGTPAAPNVDVLRSDPPTPPARPIVRFDNPGGEWLEAQQRKAKKAHDEGGRAVGAITAYTDQPVFVPSSVADTLPGARGEARRPGESQYDRLMAQVKAEGFDLSANNAILIGVDWSGRAYVIEGNTRAAVARALGIEAIPAEIRWYAGGERAIDPADMFHPNGVKQLVDDYGLPARKVTPDTLASSDAASEMLTQAAKTRAIPSLMHIDAIDAPDNASALLLNRGDLGLDDWDDGHSGASRGLFFDTPEARSQFLAGLPADKRAKLIPVEIPLAPYGGKPSTAIPGAYWIPALKLPNAHPMVFDEAGYLVGAREMLGSGSRLKLDLRHDSVEAAEKALEAYVEAANSDDPHAFGGRSGYEHMAALDRTTGNIIWRTTTNDNSAVGIPPNFAVATDIDAHLLGKALFPERSVDVWHNHPSIYSPLSLQDFIFATHQHSIRQVVAKDGDGNLYRGEGWLFGNHDDRTAHVNFQHTAQRFLWQTFVDAIAGEFEELRPVLERLDNTTRPGQRLSHRRHAAGAYGAHLAWRVLSEIGMVRRYEYRLTGAMAEMDAIMDGILAEEGLTIVDLARSLDADTLRRLEEFLEDTKRLRR